MKYILLVVSYLTIVWSYDKFCEEFPDTYYCDAGNFMQPIPKFCGQGLTDVRGGMPPDMQNYIVNKINQKRQQLATGVTLNGTKFGDIVEIVR